MAFLPRAVFQRDKQIVAASSSSIGRERSLIIFNGNFHILVIDGQVRGTNELRKPMRS